MKKVTYEQWAAAHPDERASHSQFAGHHEGDPGQPGAPTSGGGSGPLQLPPGAAGPIPGGTLSPVAYAPPSGRKRVKHDLALRNVFLVVVAVLIGAGVLVAVTVGINAFDSRPKTFTDKKDGFAVAIPADWEKTPLDKAPTADQINPFAAATSRVLYTKARTDGKLVALVSEVRPNDPAVPMDAAALQQAAAQYQLQKNAHAEATTIDGHQAVHLTISDPSEGDVDTIAVADGSRALVLVIVDRTTLGSAGDVGEIIKSFHLLDPTQSGS